MKYTKLIIIFFTLIYLKDGLASFEDYLFNTKNINTDYILIYKDNKKIFEKYNRGYKPNQKHISWSMAKTISGMLIAKAIDQGLISLNEKVSDTFPSFKGKATILDLLQMSSGIDFSEEYSGLPVSSDVAKMLFIDGPRVGFANYVLNLPLIEKLQAGSYFYYSSGDTNLLMNILKTKLSKDDYNNYPWKNLFNPLNIKATFEQDSSGSFVGSSYMYMSPDDYLKFALLFLNDGKYDGLQVLPKWYLKLINKTSKGVNLLARRGTSQRKAYSIQTAINSPIPGRNLPPEFKYLPSDTILFLGFQNQIIAVSPSQKYIVIRLAKDKGKTFNRGLFFKIIYEQFKLKDLDIAKNEFEELYSNLKITHPLKPINKTKLTDYFILPRLIKSSSSKEFCSCYFIEKRTKAECKEDLKFVLPIFPRLNIQNKSVSSDFFIDKKVTAKFRNDKLGCYLIKP